ncbi:MAG TPA: hypothetical protein VMJ35_03165 [Dongiaceae bacterium]|nr:hypothetical protein [Dongiaceae bacterium]
MNRPLLHELDSAAIARSVANCRYRRALLTRILSSAASLLCAVIFSQPSRAQEWTWSSEQIDLGASDGSLAIDADSNLHLAYYKPDGGQLMYGFRSATSGKWFTMSLDHGLGGFSSQIALDSNQNPHICYAPRVLKYAHFDGKQWQTQEIDKGGGLVSYTCSIKMDSKNRPHISWYVESGVFLRYAELKDGAWLARTLDQQGLPGKWNSLALDSEGNPHIAYIEFPLGQLRYTAFDGKLWTRNIVDAPGAKPGDLYLRGFGASLIFNRDGEALAVYYDLESLKLARLSEGKWTVSTIEQLPNFGDWAWKQFRTSTALDSKGNLHIVFESKKGLEHLWWDGAEWRSRMLIVPVGVTFFDSSMVMDKSDNIYIAYKDATEGTLKLFIGKSQAAADASRAAASTIR